MALDVLLSIDFFGHPKTVALERAVGSGGPLALLRLWCWAREHRPDGVLYAMSAASVEAAATRGHGDVPPPAGFVDALLAVPPSETVGFLDHDQHGNFRLVNWARRQPWAVNYARAKRLSELRSIAGREAAKRSVAARAAAGWKSNHRPVDPETGRFAASPEPKPERSPEPNPEPRPEPNTRTGVGCNSLPHKGQPEPNGTLPVSGIRIPDQKREESGSGADLGFSPQTEPRAAISAAAKPTLPTAQPPRPAPGAAEASTDTSKPNGGIHGPRKASPMTDSKPNPIWGTDAHGPKAPGSNGAGPIGSFAREVETLQRIADDAAAGKPISERSRRGFTLALPRLIRLRAELRASYPKSPLTIPPIPNPLPPESAP